MDKNQKLIFRSWIKWFDYGKLFLENRGAKIIFSGCMAKEKWMSLQMSGKYNKK